jgi:uncharacterized DUF497 family protein
MSNLRFVWDPRKAADNQRKHGVSFEEAKSVFLDESSLFRADPDHSTEEDRFVILGLTSGLRLPVVCHCYREAEDVIRLISARRAAKREGEQYAKTVKR